MSFLSFEIAGQASYGVWENESVWLQVPDAFKDELKWTPKSGQT